VSYQLDRRTRRDEDRRHITPDSFFVHEFPLLAAAHGRLVEAGMTALDPPPLTVEVESSVWTIKRGGGTVDVERGAVEGALAVALDPGQFSDWVQNQITLNGLLTARALQFRGGTLADVSIWDSLWVALLEGWTVIDRHLAFLDRKGASLDLERSFTPQDDPRDIEHFLREAGFVHLKGWLDPSDMPRIMADMDRALPLYREGDGKSWWATLNDGTRCCVRLQAFVEHSDTTARILASDTWARMRQVLAAQDKLAQESIESRTIEALFKPVGVVSGPSDVSFHRDCHLGRHAYVCSRMTIGIPLTPTCHANGLLRVVAGSHRVAIPVEIAKACPYLPIVALPTDPGDLTVHLSCTLHESLPPVVSERRVMYTEIPLAPFDGTGYPTDTSVRYLREQVNNILRDADANASATSTMGG